MANRMKEEEKNEKIIRGLLKLDANRRCVNCNNLGPQYVCTNFWTFVCTNCGGVHREFTHRVKSVSMAKFTSLEVQALQEGGNELARECFFKEWDPQRHSFPDSSKIDQLRDFIRHVYVERRYTGERKADRGPRVKGDREAHNENRRLESYLGGSRSPSSDDHHGEHRSFVGKKDRNFRYAYGERSPGYDRGDKRSPGYFEVVDDRRRDDRCGTEIQNRRSDDRKFPDALQPEARTSNHRKDQDASKSLMARPARDILGDEKPKSQVAESVKSNGTNALDSSAQTEKTSSSSIVVSSDDNSSQMKGGNSGSLIDFSADPGPAIAIALQQSIHHENTSPSARSSDRASLNVAAQEKASQVATNVNTLESVLAQLLVPGPAPAGNMSTVAVSSLDLSPRNNDGGQLSPMQQQKLPTVQQEQPSMMQQQLPSMVPQQQLLLVQQQQPLTVQRQQPPMVQQQQPSTMQQQQVPTVQQQQSLPVQPQQPPTMLPLQHSSYPTADSQPADQPSNAPTVDVSNNQESLTGPAAHPPHVTVTSHHQSSDGVPPHSPSAENKSTGRKELPEDLFTSLYSLAPVAPPGWQRGPQIVMGYGMQYPTGMMPAQSQPLKSANPFDVTNEPAPLHAPTFSSMMPQQGALPTVIAQPALLRTSSFGVPLPQLMPEQQLSYASVMSPSSCMMQQVPSTVPHQVPSNMISRGHAGIVHCGSEGAPFSTSGMDQHSAARYSQPSTPKSFNPVGGNPFG